MRNPLIVAAIVGVILWLYWRRKHPCNCHGPTGAMETQPPQSPVDQPPQSGGPVLSPAVYVPPPAIDPSAACQAAGGVWDMWGAMTGTRPACAFPQQPLPPSEPESCVRGAMGACTNIVPPVTPPSSIQPPLRTTPAAPPSAPLLLPPPVDHCTATGGSRDAFGSCHCCTYCGSDGAGGCLPPSPPPVFTGADRIG